MGNPINKFNINGLVRSLLLSFWTILLFCSNLYAGSAIPYIDIGTSTPTANRIVKFDANGKLPDASALSGSVTASQLASDLTLIGTTSGNFNGTHTGSGAALTGVSVAVAFSAVTGSATSAQMPSSPSFPGTMTTTSITIGTTISRNYPFTVYSSVENTINDSLVLGGLATADVEDGGTASSAIDNNSGTYWQATTVLPHYWQYDYGTGNTQRVTRLTLDAYYSGNGRQDKNWALQACNDAVSWGTITTGQDTNAAGVQTYNFSNTSFFRYYKLVFTSTWHTGGSNIAINELQMFPGTEDILTVDSSGNALVGSRLLVGTTTALGTTSANYVIQTGLNQRIVSGGTDVYCFREIKSIIDSGDSVINKAAQIAKAVKLYEYHPKKIDLPKEQIEKFAREKYRDTFVVADYNTFKQDNEATYRINNGGTHTVDYKKMKKDFDNLYGKPREDEFYLLPDMENRVSEMEISLESNKDIVNISAISNDATTDALLKGANPDYLSYTNMIGVLFGAYQANEKMLQLEISASKEAAERIVKMENEIKALKAIVSP